MVKAMIGMVVVLSVGCRKDTCIADIEISYIVSLRPFVGHGTFRILAESAYSGLMQACAWAVGFVPAPHISPPAALKSRLSPALSVPTLTARSRPIENGNEARELRICLSFQDQCPHSWSGWEETEPESTR